MLCVKCEQEGNIIIIKISYYSYCYDIFIYPLPIFLTVVKEQEWWRDSNRQSKNHYKSLSENFLFCAFWFFGIFMRSTKKLCFKTVASPFPIIKLMWKITDPYFSHKKQSIHQWYFTQKIQFREGIKNTKTNCSGLQAISKFLHSSVNEL